MPCFASLSFKQKGLSLFSLFHYFACWQCAFLPLQNGAFSVVINPLVEIHFELKKIKCVYLRSSKFFWFCKWPQLH